MRSFSGRAAQFQRVNRAKPPRAPAATFAAAPLTGYWSVLENYDWTPTPSPSFDAIGVSDNYLAIFDNFYAVQRPRVGGGWTVGNDVNDDFPGFNAAGSWTTPYCTLPDGRFATFAPFEFQLVFPFEYVGHMIAYNPNTLTWDEELSIPPTPTPGGRYLYEGHQIGALWYVVGGFDPNLGLNDGVYDLHRYNTATDTWDTLTPCPIAGFSTGVWHDGSTLWTFIDDDNNDIDGDTHLYSYSISADTWADHPDLVAVVAASLPGGNINFLRRVAGIANDRILLMYNSSPTLSLLWDGTTTPPVDVPDPIDPDPAAFPLYREMHTVFYAPNVAVSIGEDITVVGSGAKVVPVQTFTLGSP